MFQTAFKDKNKENLEKEPRSFGCLLLPLPAVQVSHIQEQNGEEHKNEGQQVTLHNLKKSNLLQKPELNNTSMNNS